MKNFVEIGKKIICVGLNYRQHAIEMKHAIPTEPVVFLKPTTSYIKEGTKIKIPKDATAVDYEIELGIIVGQGGKNIPESEAMKHVAGYCAALDMTDRALYSKLRDKSLPIALAKGFDTACPVGDFIPANQIKDPQDVKLWLTLNGELKQDSKTSDMIFSIPFLISWLSDVFTLEPGDLILTGTPEGVGSAKSGDVVECGIGDSEKMAFQIA